MRIRCGTIHIVALAALAVGAAAGWFAAGACGNVETTNVGRARSPVSPERSEPRKRWLQGCAPHPVACPVLTDLGLAKKIETSNYPTTKLPNHLTTIGVGTPGSRASPAIRLVHGNA